MEEYLRLLENLPEDYGYKPDLEPGIINDHLIVGSGDLAVELELLKKLKVTHILNLTYEIKNKFTDEFKYKTIKIDDLPNVDITNYFDEAFKFIDEANKKDHCCFIHCTMGRSRSVSIVIGYLMSRFGYEFEYSMDYVKKKRPNSNPNARFIKNLMEYGKKLDDINKKNNINKL